MLPSPSDCTSVVASAPVLWTLRLSSQRLDAIGLALVALLALWIGLFAGAGEGRPGPVLALLAGLVLTTAAGRLLAVRAGLVPRLVAVAIAGCVVLTWPGMLGAAGAPLGYANGNATMASLGVVAAVAAARSERDQSARRGWLCLAGLLGVATVATASLAGVLALAVALGLLGLSAVTRWAGFAVVGGLVAVSLTVGITTAVALGAEVGGLGERTEVRDELWAAAVDFTRDEPLIGIGPGHFADRNPVSTDADLRWAHHGYLQVAAELGLVGFALVAALLGWVWAVLWHAADDRPASSSLAATAVSVVGLHATVDYVWHFPAVLLAASALLGTAYEPSATWSAGSARRSLNACRKG